MTEEVQASSLKIEKTYPFKSGGGIKAVFIIGAGGTGSYVVQGVARDIYTMPVKPQLIICDGDTVEDKNLKRQLFSSADIGQNKAVALAERYSAAFGLQIGYRDEFIETSDGFLDLLKSAKGPCIVVTCVDNVKTRLRLREAIQKHEEQVFWIDSGNEAVAGQVVLGARIPWWKQDKIDIGQFPMPDVFDVFPELFDKLDKLPSEMSCAELAVSSPQYGFVNLTAGTVALNFCHDLLHNEPIKVHVCSFSIKNMYSHKMLKESYIQSWTKFFDKFKVKEVDGQRKGFTLFEDRKKAAAAKAAELAKNADKKDDNVPPAVPADGTSQLVEDLKAALGR